MTRNELYAMMKLVEHAVDDNKLANRPLNECRYNPAVDLVALCHKLQDQYLATIKQK